MQMITLCQQKESTQITVSRSISTTARLNDRAASALGNGFSVMCVCSSAVSSQNKHLQYATHLHGDKNSQLLYKWNMRMRNVGNFFLKSNEHKHVSIPQSADWLPEAFTNRGGKIQRGRKQNRRRDKARKTWRALGGGLFTQCRKQRRADSPQADGTDSEVEAFKDDGSYSLKSTEVRLCQHGARLKSSSRIEMQILCVKTAIQRNIHIARTTSTVANVNRVSHPCWRKQLDQIKTDPIYFLPGFMIHWRKNCLSL